MGVEVQARDAGELIEDAGEDRCIPGKIGGDEGGVICVGQGEGVGTFFGDSVEEYFSHRGVKKWREWASLSDSCFQLEARSNVS